MTLARAKGPRGKADKLFSQLVRARGHCESCGRSDPYSLQCAHIVGRRYSSTRTDTRNAFCLCYTCHRRYTDHPDEWMDFIDGSIGRAEYNRLKRKAEAGGKFGRQFWEAEVQRLIPLVKRLEAA